MRPLVEKKRPVPRTSTTPSAWNDRPRGWFFRGAACRTPTQSATHDKSPIDGFPDVEKAGGQLQQSPGQSAHLCGKIEPIW